MAQISKSCPPGPSVPPRFGEMKGKLRLGREQMCESSSPRQITHSPRRVPASDVVDLQDAQPGMIRIGSLTHWLVGCTPSLLNFRFQPVRRLHWVVGSRPTGSILSRNQSQPRRWLRQCTGSESIEPFSRPSLGGQISRCIIVCVSSHQCFSLIVLQLYGVPNISSVVTRRNETLPPPPLLR